MPDYEHRVCIEAYVHSREPDSVDVNLVVSLACTDPGRAPSFDPRDGGDPGYGPEFEVEDLFIERNNVDIPVDERELRIIFGNEVIDTIMREALDAAHL